MSTQREAFEKFWQDKGKYEEHNGATMKEAMFTAWQAHAERQWQTSGKAFMHKETGELRLVLFSDDHNFDEWEDVAIVDQPPKEKL